MRLRDWLRANQTNVIAFGRKLGLRYPKSAYRYLGVPPKRVPRPEIMARIKVLTGGKVTADDFYAPLTDEEAATPFVW
jgi:hypothetical protein